MKKLLLLGGSEQQIIAIKVAKKMGLQTILCDYLKDNPGQFYADKFYLASTTDKETILKIAKEEKINGIIAYASDPAAPTAAYVAEKLGLPGNPYKSVEILCNKDKFREFLKSNGFNLPKAYGFSIEQKERIFECLFDYPVIVKPVDSSGSKGVTVVFGSNELKNAISQAFYYSRNHRIVIEKFIEKKHDYLIGGDVFIIGGKIVLYGLLNCHRDKSVNSLVPVGKSYPLLLNKGDKEKVKKVLKEIVTKLGIDSGEMNVELIIDKNDRVYPVDIGPRSGGNMIPDLLGDVFDIDLVKASVQAAMGEKIYFDIQDTEYCYATYNLHSAFCGTYNDVVIMDELLPYVYKKYLYKKTGDKVEFFDNASKCLGIIFMKFENEQVMQNIMNRINKLIKIKLD